MRNLLKKIVVSVLGFEARLIIKKYRPRVIAVTGSVGKTSTKDAIFAMLNDVHVRKSDKSFNSEIGLPLTILGRPNAWSNPLGWLEIMLDGLFLILLPATYPRWLVLEVGADRPGDIRSLASWLPVDIAVITRLPEVPVHVEFFDSPEAVVEEKASLINALRPEGTLVVYADDVRAPMLTARALKKGAQVITFGLSAGAQVRGRDFRVLMEGGSAQAPVGMGAQVEVEGTLASLSVMGILGSHALLSSIAAVAVGTALGKNLPEMLEALRSYEPPRGRMRLLPGLKGSTIIDDTYNSSPAAVEAALDALAIVPAPGRKIAVLGDMLELGKHSVEEHRRIGAHAVGRLDLLATVGFRARDIAQGALDNGFAESMILQYEDADKAGEELAALLAQGDCILIKGSQSIRMEKTVEDVMAEPERAPELLVRQEQNWKRR